MEARCQSSHRLVTYDQPVPTYDPQRPDLGLIADTWAAEMPNLDIEALQLITGLRRVSQSLERDFTAICRRFELGTGDVRILLVLRRSPPDYALSPSDLFRELLITSGAVTKQVDRLVDAGLVTKIPDPEILRGLLVKLQPRGREVAEQALEAICSYPWLDALSSRQKQQTVRLLGQIDTAIQQAGQQR